MSSFSGIVPAVLSHVFLILRNWTKSSPRLCSFSGFLSMVLYLVRTGPLNLAILSFQLLHSDFCEVVRNFSIVFQVIIPYLFPANLINSLNSSSIPYFNHILSNQVRQAFWQKETILQSLILSTVMLSGGGGYRGTGPLKNIQVILGRRTKHFLIAWHPRNHLWRESDHWP